MGLKTSNLIIDEIGLKLDNAYAIIEEVHLVHGNGYAVFNIQVNRQAALTKKPLKQVTVRLYNINRDEPLLSQIYEIAKKKIESKRWNDKTKVVDVHEIDTYFSSWSDDR